MWAGVFEASLILYLADSEVLLEAKRAQSSPWHTGRFLQGCEWQTFKMKWLQHYRDVKENVKFSHYTREILSQSFSFASVVGKASQRNLHRLLLHLFVDYNICLKQVQYEPWQMPMWWC